jgi:voltage-gated potassium channel Kch
VFAFLMVFRRLGRAVRRGFGDPGFRGLFYLTATLLLFGSFFIARVEDWTLFQGLYWSVITLTTVGYGDFSPQTFAGRAFTIFYVLAGVGIIVALVTQIAHHAAEDRAERTEDKRRRKDGGQAST